MQLLEDKFVERVSDIRVLVGNRHIPQSWFVIKRATDIVLGSALFVATLPIVAAAATAIVLVDPGPPFFTQERVGQGGRKFRMVKLRTMVKGAHAMRAAVQHLNEVDGPAFKIRNDPRLHALGSFLRRSSIDELPNLINVIRGDMSLVGPRPPLPSEVAHYTPYALRRLIVPQGITCYWQIGGRSALSFEDWMLLDNAYVDAWTPWGDLAILAKTLPAVLRKDGAH